MDSSWETEYTLPSIKIDDLKQLVENNGGKNGSNVSAKTNYFLMGDKCGPSKIVKVKKLEFQ